MAKKARDPILRLLKADSELHVRPAGAGPIRTTRVDVAGGRDDSLGIHPVLAASAESSGTRSGRRHAPVPPPKPPPTASSSGGGAPESSYTSPAAPPIPSTHSNTDTNPAVEPPAPPPAGRKSVKPKPKKKGGGKKKGKRKPKAPASAKAVGPSDPVPPPVPVKLVARKKKKDEWGSDMFKKEQIPPSPVKKKLGGLALMLKTHSSVRSISSTDDEKLYEPPPNARALSRGRGRDRDATFDGRPGRGAASAGRTIKIVFQEHEPEFKPVVVPYNANTTVEDLIGLSLMHYNHHHPKAPVQGRVAQQYELRLCEEDDDEIEIDEDLPALVKNKLVQTLNLRIAGMCFKGGVPMPQPTITIGARDSGNGAFTAAVSEKLVGQDTLEGPEFGNKGHSFVLNDKEFSFIRILLPGPVDSNLTLKLPKPEVKLRELIPMINRKHKKQLVNTEYFAFYYTDDEGQLHGGALPMSSAVKNLLKDELVLLPTVEVCDKLHNGEEVVAAEELPYVSLLIPKEYKVWKLSDKGKRKARKMDVGRYLIRKTPTEDKSMVKRDHHPIEIGKIQRCVRSPKNERHFEIEYIHITGTNSVKKSAKKKQKDLREQVYECPTGQQCEEIVSKINYFRKISKFYGSEDPGGEVAKARNQRTLTMIRGLKTKR